MADGRRGAVQHDRAVQAQRLARRRPRGRSTPRATGSCWARARAWSWWSRPSTRCARGATPIAEILGGALTADAFHISAPDPTGRGQARAMTNALRNAGVAPDEIDWIVAHGTSTSLNDSTETRAIKLAYGSAAATRAISLAQVDDRPPGGRRRHRVGAGGPGRDPRRGHLAHREPAHAGPGVRPGLRAARARARPRWTPWRSTASASAARTRSRSSAASRRSRPVHASALRSRSPRTWCGTSWPPGGRLRGSLRSRTGAAARWSYMPVTVTTVATSRAGPARRLGAAARPGARR